jgi:tRNA nucleotidyltransferase (CCA-adding enzyme)
MQIILTHENADFDAVASLLGAHKLYPGATPVLPHRVNRNVRAFLSLYGPGFPLQDPDHLSRGQHVQRVILVDTAKLTFVRGMGKEIKQVLVIDHHTSPDEVPEGWRIQSEPLGATTTLLVEAISTRLIPISPAEATLMLAGIYEDTGSLTYGSTTPRDLRAAAWLIDQGADLEIATEFLEHPLTLAQQQIYSGLREHLQTVDIDGHPVVLSWSVSPPDTEEEVSTLAHKLRNLLEPSALFICVQIGDNTQLVARSATDDINASAVAEHFGGGGHDRAAAALIRDRSADDVYEELRELLPAFVHPRIKVRDLMSHGVRTVLPDEPIKQVSEQMLRTGHEGFPVVSADQRVVGLVTRNAVDRAMQHQLGQQPVRRVMQPGSVSVAPGDSVEYVRSLMIRTGWGQIPVISNEHLIGVVTRTDMIRLQPSTQTTERQRMAHLMQEAIAAPLLALIREIGVQAAAAESVIYFVGGIVRDLLLGHDIFDVDLVVEGEAIDLAAAMAERYGGEVRSHSRFGTAKWLLPDDIWERVRASGSTSGAATNQHTHAGRLPRFIDLVTARTEFYEHPTALPMVARSSIKQDLHRRDFTINTLAIRLDPQRWGELLDFYGGRADLEGRVLRVLHSLSFVDDPTRILRAARFEARLGFHLDQRSEALIADALPVLDKVTGERIRHEIDLIFEESEPEIALSRLKELGALDRIRPELTIDAWLSARFRRLRTEFDPGLWGLDPVSDRRLLLWALLVHRLSAKAFQQLQTRLKLPGNVGELHQQREAAGLLLKEIAPGTDSAEPAVSEIATRLAQFDLATLALQWLVTDDPWTRGTLERYARIWRHVGPLLNGDDLRAMGFQPGPLYREILWALTSARLDGEVATREDEIALIEARFRPTHASNRREQTQANDEVDTPCDYTPPIKH